jgi:lipopolysaccharide biosynthesis protein
MVTKVLAFVLPQFHRIPENDEWWGEGFTDWTNVRRAKPLFKRHHQPRVPVEQRYYDMLDPAVHDWQADLARRHGIHGFCYYHYWFNGRQLLQRPLEIILERGKPDLPFCLAWANEPWTRAWDGGDRQVLMPQTYGGPAEWRKHFLYLLRAFRDPRYIKVDGKPMFLIYRTASIDCCGEMLALWSALAREHGLPGLHLVSMLTGFEPDRRAQLFDAFADFEPMYTMHRVRKPFWPRKRERLLRQWTRLSWRLFGGAGRTPNSQDYRELWNRIVARPVAPGHYPGAFVDWDNSPRRDLHRCLVFRNAGPRTFGERFAAQYRKAVQAGAPFLFINAWNEWAEGTYLEPDEVHGLRYLEAVRDALDEGARRGERTEGASLERV